MLRTRLRSSLAHVLQALWEPEAFALRWHREGAPYGVLVFAALALTTIAGTTLYGMVIGIPVGVPEAGLAAGTAGRSTRGLTATGTRAAFAAGRARVVVVIAAGLQRTRAERSHHHQPLHTSHFRYPDLV